MGNHTPTFVDPTVDQGAHAEPCAEIWYVSCRLGSGDRDFATQAILTTSPSGRLFVMLSMLDVASGATRHATSQFVAREVDLAVARLDVRTPVAMLAGSTAELSLRASVGDDGFALRLRRVVPVLNACGTGEFPYFYGPTRQYSFPALAVSGTVDFDGTTHAVTGGGWYDRQWSTSRDAFGTANPFSWFGLCLDGGDNLSVWHAGGWTWTTVGHPDGTHTVTAVTLEERSGRCAIHVPFFAATLDVAHRRIHEEGGFYTGLCDVGGTWRRAPAKGYGFVDQVAR